MEVLRELVRDIAIIVLLASFLEMLIPNNQMKKFVKVVMGLFVIVTILGPIGNLIKRPVALEVNAWQYSDHTSEFETIMTKAESFQRDTQELATKEYVQRLGDQVAAVAKLVPGVEYVEAQVKVKPPATNQYGVIEKIVLQVSSSKTKTEFVSNKVLPDEDQQLVEPVEIEVHKVPAPEGKQVPKITSREQAKIKEQLIQTVANFYGLRTEQIEFYWR